MKAKILFLFMILGLFVTAQQTSISWTYTDGNTTYNRGPETFDWVYGYSGIAPVQQKLGVIKDGEIIYGNDALTYLNKPIWGENGNQKFYEVLPVLSPPVPKTINQVQTDWFPYPDTIPSLDSYLYEVRVALAGLPQGAIIQNQTLTNMVFWHSWAVYQWRPQNLTPYPRIPVPNPEYPIREAQREQERLQYTMLLEQTFVQTGNYTFPSLKLIDGCVWRVKYEGEQTFTTIPVSPDFPYVSASGGKIVKRRMLKPEHIKDWSTYTSYTILSQGENRVKLLLGIR